MEFKNISAMDVLIRDTDIIDRRTPLGAAVITETVQS